MRGRLKNHLFFVLLAFGGCRLEAAALSPFLFLDMGPQIRFEDPTFGEIEPEEIVSLPAKVMKPCPDNPDQNCIPYQIQIPDGIGELQVLSAVTSAIFTWTRESDLNLQFEYQGLVDAELYPEGLPYVYEIIGEEPNTESVRVQDEYSQDILSGAFFISFDPPEEIQFEEGAVSKVRHYIVPDFQSGWGEIVWAGIFINPEFNPLTDCDSSSQNCLQANGMQSFSFASVIVAEIGRALGLSASSLPTSLMFPSQTPGLSKSYANLSSDDRLRALSVYAKSTSSLPPTGSLRGRLIDGRDGSGWYGGSVLLISSENIENFTSTGSYHQVTASTISRIDGSFVFEQVPVGNYYLLIESTNNLNVARSFFDDEYKWLASTENFVAEFYDGGGRESNLEASYSFSMQSVVYAAQLVIKDSEETALVEVITNQPIANVEPLFAVGANHEILSDQQPLFFKELIDQELALDQERLKAAFRSSGCHLRSPGDRMPSDWWMLLLLLALISTHQKIIRRGVETRHF